MNITQEFQESPIQEISFRGRKYFLKRDDLINPFFNGNKARKFDYYLNAELHQITKLASYGGNQSNAMYSLAALAKLKGLQFDYYGKPLPLFLKKNPVGNYKHALEFGMNYIELPDYESFFQKMSSPEKSYDTLGKNTLLIRQGGAEKEAESGVKKLADEINKWAAEQAIKKLSVFIQSGTGTTALFLQKHLHHKVYTTPNIGNKEYLLKQFALLESNKAYYPEILETSKKYVFGKPYEEYYAVWKEISAENKIEFELLYDPKTLIALSEHNKNIEGKILYVHSGGTAGNESMLLRYKYKGII